MDHFSQFEMFATGGNIPFIAANFNLIALWNILAVLVKKTWLVVLLTPTLTPSPDEGEGITYVIPSPSSGEGVRVGVSILFFMQKYVIIYRCKPIKINNH